MAKAAASVASATAAADTATANEVIGAKAVEDAIDNIPSGQSASITDGGAVQGEVNVTGNVREELEMPIFNPKGEEIGTLLVQRY